MPQQTLPLPRIFIVEFDLSHHTGVVPIGEHDHTQFVLQNVVFDFGNFFREKFIFRIHHQQRPVQRCIETCVLSAQYFNIVTGIAQMGVHVLEIGVYVIGTPVQRIRFDFQIVSGQVSGRISETVELIPQNSDGKITVNK